MYGYGEVTGIMASVTSRLTAQDQDQLRNPYTRIEYGTTVTFKADKIPSTDPEVVPKELLCCIRFRDTQPIFHSRLNFITSHITASVA